MTPAAIVGDIHGDAGRLREMLHRLQDEDQRTIVLLGDYVNLGPDSARVLDMLCGLKERLADRLVLIEGNHDAAFKAFLRGGDIAPLLAMGGATTIRSYLGRVSGEVARAARAAVPVAHVSLLDSLVRSWTTTGVLAMHNWPSDHIDTQGRYVVLGHYHQQMHEPHFAENVAYIDTGCGVYPDGRLTCLMLPERSWFSV